MELLILASLEDQDQHGYQIGKLIRQRSNGVLNFNVASLYPRLYRMEKKGWIEGRWVEKAGERRRRFYSLTKKGKQALQKQRRTWWEFLQAMDEVASLRHA